MYIFFFRFFFLVGFYKILNIVLCAIQWSLLVTYFMYSSVYKLIPNSKIWNSSQICTSSLLRGHTHLFCIILIFSLCAVESSMRPFLYMSWLLLCLILCVSVMSVHMCLPLCRFYFGINHTLKKYKRVAHI